MKPVITSGAYGWRQSHWSGGYYPQGLPSGEAEYDKDDWRLNYYSNDFDCVLLPAIDWQSATVEECASWLDDVHADFEFFVECHALMDQQSLLHLAEVLAALKPQLTALVVTDNHVPGNRMAPETALFDLIDSLGINAYGCELGSKSQDVWLPGKAVAMPAGQAVDKTPFSDFALFNLDLKDLRQARACVDQFAAQLGADVSQASIMVNHPQLQAEDLLRFRSVLAMMGY